jgi:hypothetical protein
VIKYQKVREIRGRNLISKWDLEPGLKITDNPSQAVLVILKVLADLGNTIFVDTLTEICILSKVSEMFSVLELFF